MAKREEDLSAYAQKQLIIAFAPIGNSSDTYYNAKLTNGNRKTAIDASLSIAMGIFKPEGENARVIGYLDGDIIKILGCHLFEASIRIFFIEVCNYIC